MRVRFFIPVACLVLFAGCEDAAKPSNANFTAAINQYLAKHGDACTPIGQLPIDIPRSRASESSPTVAKLIAFVHVGLMRATDTTAVVHTLLDPLRGSAPPQPVERYELTDYGKKFVRKIPEILGQTNGLCYGQKSVSSIVRWSEPGMASQHSQAEVVYTYQLLDEAPWAKNPDVQAAVPDIRAVINGASKTEQVIDVQLSNRGWYVPER